MQANSTGLKGSNRPSAPELLKAMVDSYRNLRSYIDTGVVTSRMGNGVVHRRTFSTLFQAPKFFRFTFFSPHPFPSLNHLVTHNVIGCDGTDGYLLTRTPEESGFKKLIVSLDLAIARATGISSGSAHTIGRLLLPEVSGRSVVDLIDPTYKDDTELDGIRCFVVAALIRTTGERELWIESDSLRLRKVVIWRDKKLVSEELRENIRVNEPVETHFFCI
jgi:hypothetical protein